MTLIQSILGDLDRVEGILDGILAWARWFDVVEYSPHKLETTIRKLQKRTAAADSVIQHVQRQLRSLRVSVPRSIGQKIYARVEALKRVLTVIGYYIYLDSDEGLDVGGYPSAQQALMHNDLVFRIQDFKRSEVSSLEVELRRWHRTDRFKVVCEDYEE